MVLGDGAREYIGRKQAGLYALLQNWAGQMEGYAKTNAPWTDRTGHARQGLHGGVDDRGGQYVLYLSHGVEYGIGKPCGHCNTCRLANNANTPFTLVPDPVNVGLHNRMGDGVVCVHAQHIPMQRFNGH
jgi:hypothetical protein